MELSQQRIVYGLFTLMFMIGERALNDSLFDLQNELEQINDRLTLLLPTFNHVIDRLCPRYGPEPRIEVMWLKSVGPLFFDLKERT